MSTRKLCLSLLTCSFLVLSCLVIPLGQAEGAGTYVDQVRLRALSVAPDESADLSPDRGAVEVTSDLTPELDLTHFYNDNLGFELILGTTEHSVTAPDVGLDLGEVSLLPPTLTVQYHFQPGASFRPYVGAGVNYTIFYNEGHGAQGMDVDIDDEFGWALQAGFDVKPAFLPEGMALNVDVKKLFLEPDVEVGGGAVSGDVELDPLLVGFGVSYRL